MILMPGKDDFKGRFSWYRWSAPAYENPQEIIEVIKKSGVIGKRLRSVRVIGDAFHEFMKDEYPPAFPEQVLVNYYKAFEPFIFEFDDGSTLEFLPQGHDHSRLGFSTIPNEIQNGLTFSSASFYNFFHKAFENDWKGSILEDIEINTVKIDSSSKNPRDDRDHEIHYRFKFRKTEDSESWYFELVPTIEHNEYLIFFCNSNEPKSVSLKWLNAEDSKCEQQKHICWELVPFGGCFRIYPLDDENYKEVWWGEANKDYSLLEKLVFLNAFIVVDEDGIPDCLRQIWSKHYDPSINYEYQPEFEHYGSNLYTYQQMRNVIADVRDYIERIKNKELNQEEQDEILEWSNSYLYDDKGKSDLNEAMDLLIDFLDQYCEEIDGMMFICPDFKTIMVMGP